METVIRRFIRKPWILLPISLLAATFARIVYSGWISPLFIFPMRGDGLSGIFGGIDGYFMPGSLRALIAPILNHPYLSITFYYSIFHPLCMTDFLGVTLIAAAHICAVCIILLSIRMFDLPGNKKVFVLLLIVAIFNWAPFYDGVLQGFPPEFIEVLGAIFGFYLLLKGKPIYAGIVLGFTSTIKILPVIFIIYLTYKKQFRLVASAIVTCLILSLAILLRENFSLNISDSVSYSMRNISAYGRNMNDASLGAFIYFIFHRSLSANVLIKIHYAAFCLFTVFFIAIERRINLKKDGYLFGLAAASLAIYQISPHVAEMYCYILLLPALIFNIWMLIRYRDRFFGITFIFSYIFMHGFSLLNLLFKLIRRYLACYSIDTDMYLYFNEHGGIFIGIWLLYFSTYGLALKYLVAEKKVE